MIPPSGSSMYPLFPDRIGIWKCWFLWREENRSTRRKTLRAGMRTNNKLNPHMTPRPGIEPEPHWWEVSALTTAPSLLLLIVCIRETHEYTLKMAILVIRCRNFFSKITLWRLAPSSQSNLY